MHLLHKCFYIVLIFTKKYLHVITSIYIITTKPVSNPTRSSTGVLQYNINTISTLYTRFCFVSA